MSLVERLIDLDPTLFYRPLFREWEAVLLLAWAGSYFWTMRYRVFNKRLSFQARKNRVGVHVLVGNAIVASVVELQVLHPMENRPSASSERETNSLPKPETNFHKR